MSLKTPTDCVHLALTGLLNYDPDIVVSGINNTGNLGDDVIYSGTVSAAMEGRFLGLPAVAVSLVTLCREGQQAPQYETAAHAAINIVAQLKTDPLPADTILNVNVPDVTWQQMRGFKVTRLGNRHRSAPVSPKPIRADIPSIGLAPQALNRTPPGTDFDAVRNTYISITPIHVDLTRYQALENVTRWTDRLTAHMDWPT